MAVISILLSFDELSAELRRRALFAQGISINAEEARLGAIVVEVFVAVVVVVAACLVIIETRIPVGTERKGSADFPSSYVLLLLLLLLLLR